MPTILRHDPLTWPIGWRPSMVRTTRAQRVALKRLYDRAPIYATRDDARTGRPIPYREWRRGYVYPGHDCIMVPWAGMWIGIETDGYTHS